MLWIWISGTTAFTSWYLHNDVREKIIAFLRELDGGAYLPRHRHVIVPDKDAAEDALPARRSSVRTRQRPPLSARGTP